MGLRDLNLKIEYRSDKESEIIHDFYIPVLSKAVMYKRAVGFFSSSVLIQLTKGITQLIENGGKMQIVASPELSEEDIQAIVSGYEMREDVVQRALSRRIYEPHSQIEKERLNYIAHLIANGQLDIKIALVDKGKTNGMYHEKIGIVEDTAGDKIAFTGSLNETDNAVRRNFESIDVFRSWTGDTDAQRVLNKNNDFKKLWENETNRLTVYDFPKAVEEKILTYKKEVYMKEVDIIEKDKGYLNQINMIYQPKYPEIPNWFNIRGYQAEAIREWRNNDYVGLLNMATGTGKTLTALSAVTTLWNDLNDKLVVIIVCPYTHLVEQWKDDVKEFNMDPIIAYSSSRQRNWLNTMENKVHRYNLGVVKNLCIITTNGTYKTDKFQNIINNIDKNILLVVDEAHNAGAQGFSKYLNSRFEFRLALSATPARHMDEDGTNTIMNYFGKEVYNFGLERAIDEEHLTRYYYYPQIVYLNEEEHEEYMEISRKLSKFFSNEETKTKLNEVAKRLLIKRARLVAGASNKLAKLRELMIDKANSRYNLIYCGATYVENEVDESETRQIEAVTSILGNDMKMKIAKFTSEESTEERERIIRDFSDGETLQGIVAIKCLDEGVNIPAIQNAYILASSTNPREFIQRRGRVLRKYKGKNFAYIYDFITLPRPLTEVSIVDDNELKYDKSLIKKELERGKEFASLAENKNSAIKIFEEIELKYKKYIKEEAEN